MTAVARLETLVELDASDARSTSVSACHEAVLDDGRRLPLLDRGWSSRLHGAADDADLVWASTSIEDVEATARAAVGPDEPTGEHSRADMEASHWTYLAWELRHHGIAADADDLRRLPHEVVLGERLLARLAGARRP